MSRVIILSQAAANEAIAGIKTSAHKLQAEIHQVAVSTLDHAREFGDYRGALALVNALPNGQRVQGLVEWFKGFSNGKLTFKQNADKSFTAELKKDRVEADFQIELAMLTDFGAYTKEATPKTFSVDALIKMLEAKANNTELNSDGTPKVSPDARTVAASLVASYRSAVSTAISTTLN